MEDIVKILRLNERNKENVVISLLEHLNRGAGLSVWPVARKRL